MAIKNIRHRRDGAVGWVFVPALLLLGLPLLGAWLFGDDPLRAYFDFPPKPGRIRHAPFSWTVFLCLAFLICTGLAPFVLQAARTLRVDWKAAGVKKCSGRFPAWGYSGMLLLAVAWFFSWTRFQWFAPCQPYIFPFLWAGYIVIINAFCQKRTGGCRITSQPYFFAALFPASALFWWFFEYLNRFVLNWYYVNVDMFSPAEYVLHATLCFSTVLPAVWSTADFLGSFPFFQKAYGDFIRVPPPARPRVAAVLVLAPASAGLFLIGLLPDFLFPMLWVSPLLVIVCFQVLTGRKHLFLPLLRGDWKRLVCFSAAALVCGFFWEMWNFFSLARWEYSIPFVHGFEIFEMPLSGYAGYLPFGLECAAVGDIIRNRFSANRLLQPEKADTGLHA